MEVSKSNANVKHHFMNTTLTSFSLIFFRYRVLPPGVKSFNLCLQYRFGRCCPLGEKCPDAHGKEELEEWQQRLDQL